METFNEITALMQEQKITEPIVAWYTQSEELTQGKTGLEYEIIALEFYASYMEDMANMHSSIGSTLESLGVPGFQFGDGPVFSNDDMDPKIQAMRKFATILRDITGKMKAELEF